MAEEGVVWLGGPEQPPEPGHKMLVWRWETVSDHPCAWCVSMDGHLFEFSDILSHPWCSCRMRPAMGCDFVERIQTGETPGWIVEPVGVVPANGSQSFSQSRSGSGSITIGPASGGLGINFGETTTLNNPGDQDIFAYAVYSVLETVFCDLWYCHHNDQTFHQEVTRTETRFHTLTTNPGQYQ